MKILHTEDIRRLYFRLKSEGKLKTWEDFSKKIGYDRTYVSRVINNKEPLVNEFAEKVESVFGIPQNVTPDSQIKEQSVIVNADLKDEIIALLKEKIQRLESEKIDLARLIGNQELVKAYLTTLHEHLLRVRSKVEGKEVGVYIQESARLLGEFFQEGEQAHQSDKDSSKGKPYRVKV